MILAVVCGFFLAFAPLLVAQTVTTTVPAGNQPQALAINPVTNQIYVANFASNTVTVIDGGTNAVTPVTTQNSPTALAVNPVTNTIYVANYNSASVSVIAGASNTVVATVNVGSKPAALAVNPVTNKVYVANSSDNTITVIDGASNMPVATVPVGASPQSLGLNTVTNEIYVANYADGTITVINGATNTALPKPITVGTNPQAVGVNPVTNQIYVVNFGSNTGTLIDGFTNTVTATASTGKGPYAVGVNPVTNTVYVPNYNDNTVTVFDLATTPPTIVTIPTGGSEPYAVAVNPLTNKIYVANYGRAANDSLITVIDGATNKSTTITTTGSEPVAIAVNPVTNKIYAANSLSNNVTVIDGATNLVAATVATDGEVVSAVAVNPVTNKIYAANSLTETVAVIDGATNLTSSLPVPVGNDPIAIAVNPSTNQIYVANCGALCSGVVGNAGSITVIDGASNTPTTVTDANAVYPFAVAVNPVTNLIYVANCGLNCTGGTLPGNVTVIDGATNTVVATVSVGLVPAAVAVAVNPVTNLIYVADKNDGAVAVIDGTTNTVAATVGVGTVPVAVAVNPITNKIYVANENSANVTVIDGATNTAVATVPAGNAPVGLDVNRVTNKIYVANCGKWCSGVAGQAGNVTVIDGATNTPTTVTDPNAVYPRTVAVNPVTNKIYVANCGAVCQGGIGNGNVTVIDGATNVTTTVTDLKAVSPLAVAVNVVSSTIYVGNYSDNVSVIAEQQVSPIPLQATIAGLPGNVTNIVTPSFSFVGSSTFSPTAPPPDNLLFQVDTWQGAWSAATNQGVGNFTGQTPALLPGFHLLYAYATDGLEASLATNPSNVPSPLIGNISAYGFLVSVPTAALSTTNLSFFYQLVGTTSAAQTVTLSDSGVQLSISGITITGTNAADFTQTTTCDSWLAPNTSCQISVTFTPSLQGNESATLTVTDDSGGVPGATQTVALSGIGYILPTATLAPPSLTFSSQPVTITSPPQPVTLSDSGGPLTIYGITITGANAGDFNQTSTCPIAPPTPLTPMPGFQPPPTLPGGSNCLIQVTFTPSGIGPESATLVVTDNSGLPPVTNMAAAPATGSNIFNPPTQTVALSGTGQAIPTAALAPLQGLNFGSQPQGAASAAQPATLSDSGGALSITSILITGANAGDFKQTNTCGTSLAGGANCQIQVIFTPTVTGAESATLTVTDNSGGPVGATQSVPLTGTGQPVPTAALTPGSLVFNNQTVGTASAAQTAKLGNSGPLGTVLTVSSITITGTNAADFQETDNCSVTLASGANCQIQVTFTPSMNGAESATLTVTDNSGGVTGTSQTVALSGTGQGVPTATLAPPTGLSFGSQPLGSTSAAQTATLGNSGPVGTVLTVSGITITGANAADFKQTNTCGATLAAGANCPILVTFTPSVSGAESASLAVTDNSGNVTGATQSITLSGTGQIVPTAALAPPGLNFNNQPLGTTSAAKTATLSDSGASLSISGITITGANAADFQQTNTCGTTLAAGTPCQILVTFTPSVNGAESATLTVTDNSGGVSGATQTVTLSGSGQPATAALAPPGISFGNQMVGMASTAQTATLSDSGAALSISGIAITGANAGDFKQTNTCGATLAAGTQCQILVTFTPSVVGAETATLAVTDNSGDVAGTTQTVPLSGSGQDFSMTATSTSLTVTAGNTANDSLQITPEGGMTGMVTLTCSGAPLNSTCTISPSPLSMVGTGPMNAMLTITTTASSDTLPRLPEFPRTPPRVLWLGLLALLGFAALASMRRFRLQAAGVGLLTLLLAVALGLASVSCGGGATTRVVPPIPGTPAGSYMLTVTATCDNMSHKMTVSLTVQ